MDLAPSHGLLSTDILEDRDNLTFWEFIMNMLRSITNPYLHGWYYTCILKHFSIAMDTTTYKRILVGYLSAKKPYENVFSITDVKSAHSLLIRCSSSSETALFSIVGSNHSLYGGLNWELHALCWMTKHKKIKKTALIAIFSLNGKKKPQIQLNIFTWIVFTWILQVLFQKVHFVRLTHYSNAVLPKRKSSNILRSYSFYMSRTSLIPRSFLIYRIVSSYHFTLPFQVTDLTFQS